MFAIYKRELRAAFHHLSGWLFAAALLLTAGITVFVFNFLAGSVEMIYAMPEPGYVLAVAVPLLCASAFASDRCHGTDVLYDALPVSTVGIVLGKYLARLTWLAFPTLVLCLYPLILSLYGTANFAGAYTVLLLFFLMGAALMALCMFISTFSRRTWVNALVGIAASALLLAIPYLLPYLPASWAGFVRVVDHLSPYYHYKLMISRHVLDAEAVLLLLSYVAVFLCLTVLKRMAGRVRTAVMTRVAAATVGCTCLLSVANIALVQLPGGRVDVSSMGFSRVSTETTVFLQNMKKDATVWWLCEDGEPSSTLELLLERYDGGHVTVRILDINDKEDADVARLLKTHGELSAGSMVVECAETERARAISADNLYYYVNDYINYMAADYLEDGEELQLSRAELEYYTEILKSQNIDLASGSNTYSYFNGEPLLTGALDYVTTDYMPVIYQLAGHGGGVDAEVAELLAFVSLDLSAAETMPLDAACVVICDPESDLSDHETELLTDFVEMGGAIVLSTAAGCESWDNLMSVCALFGVGADTGVISDPDSLGEEAQKTEPAGTILPQGNINSEIGRIVQEAMSTAFLLMTDAHRITLKSDDDLKSMGVGVFTLLATTDTAKLTAGDHVTTVPEGEEGFTVAVEASRSVKDADGNNATAYLTWYAADGLFTSAMAEKTENSNLLYLAATINATTESFTSDYNDLDAVNMSLAAMTSVSGAAMILWGLIMIVFLPLGLVTIGVVIFYKRRGLGRGSDAHR